jgi:FkbM family methyltransferase
MRKHRRPNRKPTHNWEKYHPLKEGDVFVEAGAWVGYYGYQASPLVGDDGLVLLIEPYPMNVEKIRGLIERWDLDNVIVVEKAIYKEKKLIGFSTHRNSVANRIQEKSEFMVQADTLDNILSDHGIKNVNLLGADVEGAEYNMLLGAHESLSNHRIKNIAVATYHDRGIYTKMVSEKLKEYGYEDIIREDLIVYGHTPRPVEESP